MAKAAGAGAATRFRRTHHTCRIYGDAEQFRRRAAEFLLDGAAAGHSLRYVGDGFEPLCAAARDGAALRELRARGDLTVEEIGDTYGHDDVVDPHAVVAAYDRATRGVLAEGYQGLWVAAEATSRVRTPAQREAFARYEHLVDRYMLDHPFTALCGYDERELGPEAAAELACLHPLASRGATAFHWHAAPDGAVALRGEIDMTAHAVFAATLSRTLPLYAATTLVVDAAALAFIDHRALLLLDEHAARAGAQVALRAPSPVVERLADLLELGAVRAGWSH